MTDDEYRARREAIDAGPVEDRARDRAILEYEWYEERDPTDELCHRADILPHLPAILAEVRRLRAIEATAVQRVEMASASERVAAAAMKRSVLAERLAEATIENQDAWADATHDAKRWMASCDAWRAAVDAYRATRGT